MLGYVANFYAEYEIPRVIQHSTDGNTITAVMNTISMFDNVA